MCTVSASFLPDLPAVTGQQLPGMSLPDGSFAACGHGSPRFSYQDLHISRDVISKLCLSLSDSAQNFWLCSPASDLMFNLTTVLGIV